MNDKRKFRAHLAMVLVALLRGDRQNTLRHSVSIWTKVSSAWYWKLRFPLAYELWRELSSLPCRISAIHEIAGDRLGVDMDSRQIPASLGWRLDSDFHSRSADIQKLKRLYPWVTAIDLELFLQGRKAGVECVSHNVAYLDIPKQQVLA